MNSGEKDRQAAAAPGWERLSSRWTFFYKYLLCLLWLVGFGYGARQIIFAPPFFDGPWLQYTGVWLAIGALMIILTGSIKVVWYDSSRKEFHVSDYRRSILLPLAAVDQVGGSSFFNPKLVWLSLREPGRFGRRILFMPPMQSTGPLGRHPLVGRLAQTVHGERPDTANDRRLR